MTLEQAQRILTDPKYVRALIQQATEQIAREAMDASLLNPTQTRVTPEDLIFRQGIVRGLRIADSFFVEALREVAEARADEAAEVAAKGDGLAPPALVAAMATVARPDDGGPATD